MGFRFRRSVKVFPGFRLNFSGSGVSSSFGGRGYRVTVGRRGVTQTAGIPGTGLSYSTTSRSSTTAPRRSRASVAPPRPVPLNVEISIDDRGELQFRDPTGRALEPAAVVVARKTGAAAIATLLESVCAERNAARTELADVHARTPAPGEPLEVVAPAQPAAPEPPPTPRRRWFHWLLRGAYERAMSEHARQVEAHRKAMQLFESEWAEAQSIYAARCARFASAQSGDPAAIEAEFEAALDELSWPRETSVSFELNDHGSMLSLAIDLPEIEQLPADEWAVQKRDQRLALTQISDTERRRRYARHIHGVLFRAVGEAFARFPTIERVVAYGYSQRPGRDGVIQDDVLLKLAVSRERWVSQPWSDVPESDPVEMLGSLGVERNMTKTGIFKALKQAT